jgi:hypothetical protein
LLLEVFEQLGLIFLREFSDIIPIYWEILGFSDCVLRVLTALVAAYCNILAQFIVCIAFDVIYQYVDISLVDIN